MKRLLLVDGHYYAYRSFFAIRSLTNSRGEPTNALYGMAKAFEADGGGPPARLRRRDHGRRPARAPHGPSPGVQGERAETPEALSFQFPAIEELARRSASPTCASEGEEADDLLACYAREAERNGMEAVLATNDKDLMQLVGDAIRVYQPNADGYELLDAAAVEAKWGVPPEKIGDILTLTGDAVDNIPGVPGVGPKTAAGWIREYGSVEALLENVAKLKSEKQRAALEASRAAIARNRILVALREDLPLPRPVAEMPFRPVPALQAALFEKLEFRGFLAEARREMERGGAAQGPAPEVKTAPAPAPQSQGELF